MKTIKERAKQNADNNCFKGKKRDASIGSYMLGATEQKEIMIGIFKEWLWDNIKIAQFEENRVMLNELLKRLEE